MRTNIAIWTVPLLAALLFGCASDAGRVSPVALSTDGASAQSAPSQQLWGLWEITLNTETGRFESVPIRSAAFQANVTQFLQPPSSPTNLLSVALIPGESDFPSGLVVCTVTVRHPFPGLPQYRGFDVRGICMGDATHYGETGDGEAWPEQYEMRVLNADGYTRWWNPTEFTKFGTIFGYTPGKLATAGFLATGTVNGYKYFADGLSAEDPLSSLDVANRGTYAVSPGINSREYRIQFTVYGGPQFKFDYAVTASYYDPDPSGAPTYPIDSFPISANCPEAFRIDMQDTGSDAYYESPSKLGGALKFNIEVFDWGFAAAQNVTDEIAGITLESPSLFSGKIDVDLDQATPGSTPVSRIFPVIIHNVTPSDTAGQEIMVRVLSAKPSSYAPDIPDVSGFPYPENAPLTAYYLWTATILSSQPQFNAPQVGVISGPDSVMLGENGIYNLSYANDVEDGTNLTILWDQDGDLDFNDDLDGNNSDLSATLNWPVGGNYHVIARAVDSDGHHTDSAPYDVSVEYCPTHIHNAFGPFTLGGAPPIMWVRMDTAYQTVGQYAGQLLVQLNEIDIQRFDTTGSGTWVNHPYINLVGADESTYVASIDVDDYSGRVLVGGSCVAWPDDQFQIYDVNGAFLGAASVGPGYLIGAIDTDKNGDVWVLSYLIDGIPPYQHTYLQHMVYQNSAPYYVEDTADRLDITDRVPILQNVWDIAISYSLRRLLVFHGNYGIGAMYGEVYCYDMNADGTLTYNDGIRNPQVFPTPVYGSVMGGVGYCTNGDIEIDHASEASDGCRIIVMARTGLGPMSYFALLDENLNMVELMTTPSTFGETYAFTIRQDPDPLKRQLVATSFSSGTIYKSEAPSDW